MTNATIPHVSHPEIAQFAVDRVNLPSVDAQAYREQVNRLSTRLSKYIEDNPGFALIKMLHAGSVAKGTALRTINDMDVAVYVSKESAPEIQLVPWLAARLQEAYPDFKQDQFDDSQPNCVTIRFKGVGLDVDVVPVLYEGDADDRGYLIDKYTGDKTLTSIPLHLEFIRTRKERNPNYAQVVRLTKWWAVQQKTVDPDFKCKSFLLELLLAELVDDSVDFSDYPTILSIFLSRVVMTGLESRIAFSDYYRSTSLPSPTGAAIEVFDPVNPENNITEKYTLADRNRLVSAAEDAADAISEALYATTKSRAITCWQRVLGPTFRS